MANKFDAGQEVIPKVDGEFTADSEYKYTYLMKITRGKHVVKWSKISNNVQGVAYYHDVMPAIINQRN